MDHPTINDDSETNNDSTDINELEDDMRHELILFNLPRFLSIKEFKKFFSKFKIETGKISFPSRSTKCYMTLKTLEEKIEAERILESKKPLIFKGNELEYKFVYGKIPIMKTPQKDETKCDDIHGCTEEELKIKLFEAIAPYWNIDYDEQLKLKTRMMRGVLKKLGKLLKKKFNYPSDQLLNETHISHMLQPIVGSPVLKQYRNKVSLGIGPSADDPKKVCVGFRIGKLKSGSFNYLCDDIPTMKNVVNKIANITENIVNLSGIPGNFVTSLHSEIYWSTVTVRFNQNDQMMIIFEIMITDYDEILYNKVKDLIREHLISKCDHVIDIISVYICLNRTSKSTLPKNSYPKYECIYGDKYIMETLFDYKFRISPDAFFQTNTKGAERLYQILIDDINNYKGKVESSQVVLLDVCCGTGTIGISLSNVVDRVYGIEIVSSAIEDAIYNAKYNNTSNVSFLCSDVRDVINDKWMHNLKTDCDPTSNMKIVAIVDPPRVGLDSKVIRCLRKNNFVSRILFVACDPQAIIPNIADLLRKKTKTVEGQAFTLQKCIPVDMFPYTKHCELIFVLER